ncbi:F0F1 ATP synthase subunit A [Odoribacter sp. OttesenSCG-928-J03]|nr:F0F1 ATP synthase subunit A [Odoribacter sp. OttesenSCG-928-J03]MDL2283310.1 F0F1 ATP synthase subunit A [Odoribacter sp. OttesenSCG-928-G04]
MLRYILITVFVFLSFSVFAETEKEKTYDPGESIFEHLGDEYGWTTPLPNHKSLHLPLPVIVRSSSGEWHFFSSTRLRNGNEYRGFYIPSHGDKAGKVMGIDSSGAEYRPWDLSLTKNAFSIILAMLFVLLSIFPLVRWYKQDPLKAPRRGLGILEVIIEMVYMEGIKPILGKEAHRFAPYLLTAFFFILYANILGMMVVFPGGANMTGNLAITLVLALCTLLVVNIFGTKHYWKEIFTPEVPLLLKFPVPIMPLVEIIGIFTKPIALMIRLFANMLSGHLITLVLISLIFVLGYLGSIATGTSTVLAVALAVFMNIVDLMICFIQAYVFMMLSTIFISMAREK